ncbi:MAG TPA: lysophospholipid acyltransferase family protein [Pseudonocardia sp.]|nr:lysophospholipid acyltransferase family protein [Pseudonocardia sp.]
MTAAVRRPEPAPRPAGEPTAQVTAAQPAASAAAVLAAGPAAVAASPAAAPEGPASVLAAAPEAPEHPVLPPVTERAGHSWAPASPCNPDCLPTPGTLPELGRVRVALRLTGLLVLVLATALLAAVLPLLGTVVPAFNAWRRVGVLRVMFRALLYVIGVRLVHNGADRFDVTAEERAAGTSGVSGASVSGAGVPDYGGGVLVVANHLSWLDILVLGSVQPMRMVAKREVRDWPLVGAVATRAGTLFVDRAGLRALPGVVAEVTTALRAGAAVGLFPEGTTWCGAATGVFRRAGFQAALDAGVPVRPVAQRMRLADGTATGVGAFIGDDTLVDSLLRVARLPELVMEVDVLPPLLPTPGLDRRELARRAELAIAAASGVPAPAAVRRPTSARKAA